MSCIDPAAISINLQFPDDRASLRRYGIGGAMLDVAVRFYTNGAPRIDLVEADTGAPWATATVNLPHEDLPDGLVAIKDWSENEGMADLLSRNGLIAPQPSCTIPTGHVEAPVYALTDAMMLVVDEARDRMPASLPRPRLR